MNDDATPSQSETQPHDPSEESAASARRRAKIAPARANLDGHGFPIEGVPDAGDEPLSEAEIALAHPRERRMYRPDGAQALASVQRGLAQSADGEAVGIDLGRFGQYADEDGEAAGA